MPRLIWVFAGRTLILLVLSCRGSFVVICYVSFTVKRPSSVICRPSSVCLSSTIFKHLLLRNHWADWSKFHMESPWDGGMKVCSNGPGHMTKMAAMSIYGKKTSSPEPKGRCLWNLVCSIKCSSTTKFVQLTTLGWPWTILRQGQIWSLMLLYGKKVKQ